MKIALVVPGGVDRSGTERVIPALLALLRQLSAHHELHVYALWQGNEPADWRLCGAAIHNIGVRDTRTRAVRAIRREHQRSPFQLVQSIWSGTAGLVAILAARVIGVPGFVHVAGGELCAMPAIGYGGCLRWHGRAREAVVLRLASAVSTNSAPMVASLARLGIRAHRVPLGVDLAAWPPRPPAPRSPGAMTRLLHVGSINRVKDQATLLRAFAVLASARAELRLDIVGVDTLHGELQGLAQSLGIDARVIFHGELTHAQLRPYVEAAQLLVMSSLHEAGPMVVLEAAIVGVPTVGTRVGHIAEWEPDAALATSPGDASGLAALIARLLDNEALRLRIAAEAQRRAMNEDAGHTLRCFEQLYAALGCH